ncbi:unnamed protein product [Nezara viridula]|uniref:Uncharacterized protein n=1 Tax=Nezara viridula TaxID=85310 RepID=A0A9P0MZD7_NEZVI|nr:unnamed protein product [Nezara viridula]
MGQFGLNNGHHWGYSAATPYSSYIGATPLSSCAASTPGFNTPAIGFTPTESNSQHSQQDYTNTTPSASNDIAVSVGATETGGELDQQLMGRYGEYRSESPTSEEYGYNSSHYPVLPSLLYSQLYPSEPPVPQPRQDEARSDQQSAVWRPY